MKTFSTILLLLTFHGCFAQTRLDHMMAQLRHNDFGKVYQVKDSVVNRGKEAIPQLVKLLKDTSFMKLENTADLIYPGASKFYGHGWIVNYDIDWVSARAAWLLEEIAFQNFGYQKQVINEDQLMELHKHNYQFYLKSGSHSVDLKGKTPKQMAVVYRQLLADSISRWWDRNQNTWTRYNALKEALASRDELRQSLALHFLRFEKTKCDGLTLDNYQKELMPLVLEIKERKGSQAEQAKLLLDDKEFYWLKLKKNG